MILDHHLDKRISSMIHSKPDGYFYTLRNKINGSEYNSTTFLLACTCS